MSYKPYTTADLITNIERRGFIPASQSTFDTDGILAIASEEYKSNIFPAILAAREEFFVFKKTYAITDGQAEYDVPPRAFNNLIREIKILRGNNLEDIPRIEPEALESTQQGNPVSFYLRDDKIVLHPTPSSTTDTLWVDYYLMPGEFVQTTSAAVISAIDTGTNVVSVTTIPSDWVTGYTLDFLRGDGGHQYRGVDYVSTLISGTDITFASLPSSLAVGDYINIQSESSLVQVPYGMRSVIAQFAAAALLGYSNQPGAAESMDKASGLLNNAIDSITPRVRGEDQIINQVWF